MKPYAYRTSIGDEKVFNYRHPGLVEEALLKMHLAYYA